MDSKVKTMVASLRGWLSPGRDPAIAPRPWRMWGDELRSTKAGGDPEDANLDNSDLVATFESHPGRYGGVHVAELYFVCELVKALPALLDEIERLDCECNHRTCTVCVGERHREAESVATEACNRLAIAERELAEAKTRIADLEMRWNGLRSLVNDGIKGGA